MMDMRTSKYSEEQIIGFLRQWNLGWNGDFKPGRLIFEVVRMSWLAIPITSLAIIHASSKTRSNWLPSALPAVVVLLFSLLVIPYSMGRIDPNSVSRMGLAAMFGWTILLPIMTWYLIEPRNRVALILLIAGMSATLNFSPLSLSSLVSAVSAQVPSASLKNGQNAGLPNLGIAVIQDEHWDRLVKLNALFTKKLLPNETFLDLSSRQAQYFYLDRLPPVAVTAPYNMVSLAQQRRAVAELSRNPPRLVLLEGGGFPCGIPFSIGLSSTTTFPQQKTGSQWGTKRKVALRMKPARSKFRSKT